MGTVILLLLLLGGGRWTPRSFSNLERLTLGLQSVWEERDRVSWLGKLFQSLEKDRQNYLPIDLKGL